MATCDTILGVGVTLWGPEGAGGLMTFKLGWITSIFSNANSSFTGFISFQDLGPKFRVGIQQWAAHTE
jgi:hypothetical protein